MTNTPLLKQWLISFRWNYKGILKEKTISKQAAERDNLNGPVIRIGRVDPCNLKLEEKSVSREHAEIYCNEQEEKFFIKSLVSGNTTKVDALDLIYGEELPLKVSSTLVLGQQEIEVTSYRIFEVEPTNSSGVFHSSSNSGQANPTPSLSQINPKTSKSTSLWSDAAKASIIVGFVAGVASIIVAIVNGFEARDRNKDTLKVETEKTKLQISVDKRKLDDQKSKEYMDRLVAHREKVRLLFEKNKRVYNKLILKNECHETVSFAVSFTALDDVQETRGWQVLQPGEITSPGYKTNYGGINLYAHITSDDQQKIEWKGDGVHSLRRFVTNEDFDYIEEPIFDQSKSIEKVKFHTLFFDHNSDKETKRTFTCDESTLYLK